MLVDCIHELSTVYNFIFLALSVFPLISYSLTSDAYVINEYRAEIAWSLISTILIGKVKRKFSAPIYLKARAESVFVWESEVEYGYINDSSEYQMVYSQSCRRQQNCQKLNMIALGAQHVNELCMNGMK